jgi:transcriptional regulator with XRE-family HTH domain
MEGELQRLVGLNLRAVREVQGVSQEAFAHQLGFHRTYLASIERGERNLSLRSVERLAGLISLSPLELLSPPAPAGRRRARATG